MKLGKNFTLQELTNSQTAVRKNINNAPTPEITKNLKRLVTLILQPLRDHVGVPIMVTSGYRSPQVNKAIGGSKTSQHMQGLAADINIPGYTIRQIIKLIKDLDLPYDQLINEYDRWVHVSTSPVGITPRKSSFSIGVKK